MENVLEKFNGRANDYVAGRPTYANAFVRSLFFRHGLSEISVIADIGCGTGKFSGQLLKCGCTVYGVEPNDDMRNQAVELLSNYPNFHIIKGTEANTSLENHFIDAVTSAQAFHWFDVGAFQKECKRILKPDGKVFLIWNMRDLEDEVNRESYDIYKTFCPNFKGYGGGIEKNDNRIRTFFSDHYEYEKFNYPLHYTKEAFIRRSLSGSYSLKKGDEMFPEYIEALKQLFNKYEKNGILTMGNHTVAYSGILSVTEEM